MTIELRLSNVDPPTPEPKRTIYRDIVNLPDPVLLGLTVRYFNYDSVGLYFKITGSATGYTFDDVELGLLASGTDAYKNLDEFASRAKPSDETEENITVTLSAYTDAAYTDLKWTFDRIVHVIFINSADPSYTTDYLDNFDDGTVQGWDKLGESGSVITIWGVATDYVLSPPYSLKMGGYTTHPNPFIAYIFKSITTPNRDIVYAIADVRVSATLYLRCIQLKQDGTVLIHLGRDSNDTAEAFPQDKWVRLIVPLPKNTTLELRIRIRVCHIATEQAIGYLWLDDFKVISK